MLHLKKNKTKSEHHRTCLFHLYTADCRHYCAPHGCAPIAVPGGVCHYQAGELKSAVGEVEKLSGLPADVAEDWLKDAKTRLTADEVRGGGGDTMSSLGGAGGADRRHIFRAGFRFDFRAFCVLFRGLLLWQSNAMFCVVPLATTGARHLLENLRST